MRKITDLKYHKAALDRVKEFQKLISGIVKKPNSALDSVKVTLTPQKRGFEVAFMYDQFHEKGKWLDIGKTYKQLQVSYGKEILILESLYLRKRSPPLYEGDLDLFYTKSFSKKAKYYYRLIIPLKQRINFRDHIEEKGFKTDLGYSTSDGIFATIDAVSFHVCLINDSMKSKSYYLSIESKARQDLDTFNTRCYSLQVAIGLVTGEFIADKGFYFAYRKADMKDFNHFCFSTLGNSLESSYSPINARPSAYLSKQPKLMEKYRKEKTLRPLNSIELSNLCQKLNDSTEFQAVCVMIIEASVASLLIAPGAYSIALENLTQLIRDKEKYNVAPIKDKGLAGIVIKECLQVINKYSESKDYAIDVLTGKIERINQPTNKAKLQLPFDKLNVLLSKRDLEILETRNDFLHGRIPDITKAKANRTLERLNKDMYYCSMRFYTLLNILILKWIGYDNYVVNYPKLHERFTGIELDEEPYRKV